MRVSLSKSSFLAYAESFNITRREEGGREDEFLLIIFFYVVSKGCNTCLSSFDLNLSSESNRNEATARVCLGLAYNRHNGRPLWATKRRPRTYLV